MSAAVWTYLGEFPGTDTKTVAVWRVAEDGTRLAWKASATTRGVAGYTYLVDEFDGTRWPSPQWTGEPAADAAEIQLIARREDDRRAIERAKARAKRDPQHAALMGQVARFAAGMSPVAREQLAAELGRAVWRP